MSAPAPAAAPEAVATAWTGVVADWDNQARHDALLGLVAQYSCYAWAAAKYKERAGDAVADRQLVRLRKAVTATLLATATPRPDKAKMPFQGSVMVLVMVAVLTVIGLIYLQFRSRGVAATPAGQTHAR